MTITDEPTATVDPIDFTIDEILRKAGVDPARDRWLRKPAMAKVLDTTVRTVDRRIEAGLLNPFRDGTRVLFSIDSVRRYLKAGFAQGDEAA